jgi:hypothetical protein
MGGWGLRLPSSLKVEDLNPRLLCLTDAYILS